MFDDLANFPERFFAVQRGIALEIANWFIHQIEKPVKLLARPKSEHPSTYEVVEPQPGQYD